MWILLLGVGVFGICAWIGSTVVKAMERPIGRGSEMNWTRVDEPE